MSTFVLNTGYWVLESYYCLLFNDDCRVHAGTDLDFKWTRRVWIQFPFVQCWFVYVTSTLTDITLS